MTNKHLLKGHCSGARLGLPIAAVTNTDGLVAKAVAVCPCAVASRKEQLFATYSVQGGRVSILDMSACAEGRARRVAYELQ